MTSKAPPVIAIPSLLVSASTQRSLARKNRAAAEQAGNKALRANAAQSATYAYLTALTLAGLLRAARFCGSLPYGLACVVSVIALACLSREIRGRAVNRRRTAAAESSSTKLSEPKASAICRRHSLVLPGSGSSGCAHIDRGMQTRPKGPTCSCC
jgi:hypothetical protein